MTELRPELAVTDAKGRMVTLTAQFQEQVDAITDPELRALFQRIADGMAARTTEVVEANATTSPA